MFRANTGLRNDIATGATMAKMNVIMRGGHQGLTWTAMKISGKGSWKTYRAQLELVADTKDWSEKTKEVQLVLSLMEDATFCLQLLSPKKRLHYSTRFRECNLRDSPWCEFKQRDQHPRSLVHEIKGLGRHVLCWNSKQGPK